MRIHDLMFELPPAARLTGIGLGAMTPENLLGIEVHCDGRWVFGLQGYTDARGVCVPAGTLLDAMSRATGAGELCVDLGQPGEPCRRLQVALWLAHDHERAQCSPRWHAVAEA